MKGNTWSKIKYAFFSSHNRGAIKNTHGTRTHINNIHQGRKSTSNMMGITNANNP